MRTPKSWIIWAGCISAMSIAFGGVSAESIEGSVRANRGSDARPDAGESDYYWKVWNGALPELPDSGDYNDTLAVLTGKFTGPPIGCDFGFAGGGLEPSTLAARSGTTIRVENRDAFTHELTVKGLPGFTSLESSAGKIRAVAVPAGGPWELGDRIYGHVDGYLHSLRELVACAQVTPDGKFRFNGVPPGPYSLRILRGAEQVAIRRVTVTTARTLQVDTLTLKESGR
ncbi:MAG: carboxypeptidase-like regulatory domain-containing protein [Polyangiales bacterium]